MAPVNCEVCGKQFKDAIGLKIHTGVLHKSVRKLGKRRGRKAAQAAAPTAGALVCDICGRKFQMPAHLARHKSASHKGVAAKAIRIVRRRRGRPVVAAKPSGVNVAGLSIDELLALKGEVDARLHGIVQMIRQSKVKL